MRSSRNATSLRKRRIYIITDLFECIHEKFHAGDLIMRNSSNAACFRKSSMRQIAFMKTSMRPSDFVRDSSKAAFFRQNLNAPECIHKNSGDAEMRTFTSYHRNHHCLVALSLHPSKRNAVLNAIILRCSCTTCRQRNLKVVCMWLDGAL